MLRRRGADVVVAGRCSSNTCSWRYIRRPLAARASRELQHNSVHSTRAQEAKPWLHAYSAPPSLLEGGKVAAAVAAAALLLVSPVQALESGKFMPLALDSNTAASPAGYHPRVYPPPTTMIKQAMPGTAYGAGTAIQTASTSSFDLILAAAGDTESGSSSCSAAGCSGCTWCGCQGMDRGEGCGCGTPRARQGVADASGCACDGGCTSNDNSNSNSTLQRSSGDRSSCGPMEGALACADGDTHNSCSCSPSPAAGVSSTPVSKQLKAVSAGDVPLQEQGWSPPGQQQEQQQQPPSWPQQPPTVVPPPAMPSAPMPLPLSPCPAPQAEPLPRCPPDVAPPALLPPAPSAPTTKVAPHG